MPKRKKRGAILGNKRKGYWKEKDDNTIVDDNVNTTNTIINYVNNSNAIINENITINNCSNELDFRLNSNDTNNDIDRIEEFEDAESDEKNIVINDEKKQKVYFTHLRLKARRWSIFDLFVYKYNGLDPPDGNYYKLWMGRKGLAAKIRRDLDIKSNNGFKMIPIFETILECLRTESDFHPKLIEKRGGQRPVNIT